MPVAISNALLLIRLALSSRRLLLRPAALQERLLGVSPLLELAAASALVL